jgi:hypothetical protein
MSEEKQLVVITDGGIMPFEKIDPSATEKDVASVVQFVNDQDADMAYNQPRVYASIKEGDVRFTQPGADEPMFKEDVSEVIIIAGVRARALRLSKDDKIPVCISTDGGHTGTLTDGALERHPDLPIPNRQKCDACQYNRWGTAVNDQGVVGKGKQCRERRNILMVHPGFAVPVIMGLSPTSIGAWDTYATNFVVRRPASSYIAHITRIGAKTEKRDAQKWSIATFAAVRKAQPSEVVGAAQLRELYMPLLVRYEDEADAAVVPGEPEQPPDDMN